MNFMWNELTKEELKHLYYNEGLSDRQIADLFGVPKSKVTYKRKKFGISNWKKVYQKYVEEHSELFEELNSSSKERLLKRDNIDILSKAITHYIFRNGPIEDMHAGGQLSENDMKTLNKYMVNRIAGLLTTIADNNWLNLELLLSYYGLFGTEWDKAEPDTYEIDFVLKTYLKYGNLW